MLLRTRCACPLNVMLKHHLSVMKDQAFGTEEAQRAGDHPASTRRASIGSSTVHDLSCIAAGCFRLEKALVPSHEHR